MTPPTRSAATQKIYDTRAVTTLHRYEKESGHTWLDDPMRFAEWMLQQKPRWKRSTWRMTRLAVQEALEKEGAPVEALQHFNDGHNPEGKAPGQFKTRRVRGLPDDDLKKILSLLQGDGIKAGIRKGTYDEALALFLQANIMVGLRPSEWDTAQWAQLDGVTVLRVKNRKSTNGRGNGQERLLYVQENATGTRPAARATIQALMDERDRFTLLGASWADVQNGMANRLKEIRHLVTSKTYTLYSTRHRFVSAAKQSGHSKTEIANMLGHASEETAGLHYGRRSATTGGGTAPESSLVRKHALIAVTMGVGVSESAKDQVPTVSPRQWTQGQPAHTDK